MSSAGRPTVGIPLAPSKTPTIKQQQQAAAARRQTSEQQTPAAAAAAGPRLATQHSIDDALQDLNELHLAESEAAAAAAAADERRISSNGTSSSGAASEAAAAASGGATGGTFKKRGVAWRPLDQHVMEPDLRK